MSFLKSKTAVVASALALSLGGAAPATAATGQSGSSRSGPPNETALTGDTATKVREAALAKVPGVKAEAAVDAAEAAHRAEHERRDAAMAAALAGELGLSTAKVRAALEANRPQRPGSSTSSQRGDGRRHAGRPAFARRFEVATSRDGVLQCRTAGH